MALLVRTLSRWSRAPAMPAAAMRELNPTTDRARNTVLKSWVLRALAHKEKCDDAPRRAKDSDSGADFSRAQGKGILAPAAPRNNQRIPCKSSLPKFLNN